jgi:hypothetical protein
MKRIALLYLRKMKVRVSMSQCAAQVQDSACNADTDAW